MNFHRLIVSALVIAVCSPFFYVIRECDHTIVETSGKMETLDRLLRRLKEKGHRAVVFSQFTRFLDIIDDYLNMRGYSFVRLDGSVNRVQVEYGVMARVSNPTLIQVRLPTLHLIMAIAAHGGYPRVQQKQLSTLFVSDEHAGWRTGSQSVHRRHRDING